MTGMKKGLVYIFTNPCLDGWVKIGMTNNDDIKKRLEELNKPTNLPLSFHCYATYKVDDPLLVEQKIHSILDRIDDTLHAQEQMESGKIRKREFFRISPETAYGIFKDIALLRGDFGCLEVIEPSPEDAEYRKKRSNNSFELLGIKIGETISFLYDDSVKAKVVSNKNKIEYEGNEYTVSGLANQLLVDKCKWDGKHGVNGWLYFTKEGRSLSDLREQIETDAEE